MYRVCCSKDIVRRQSGVPSELVRWIAPDVGHVTRASEAFPLFELLHLAKSCVTDGTNASLCTMTINGNLAAQADEVCCTSYFIKKLVHHSLLVAENEIA